MLSIVTLHPPVAEVNLLHAAVRAHLVLVALRQHAALVQHGHALRKRERDVHVVLDEQHGDGRIERLENRLHRLALARRQPAIGSSSSSSRGRPAIDSATSSFR